METMLDIVGQEAIEEQFNKKHIDTKIRAAINDSADMQAKLATGIELVNAYLEGKYYASKEKRVKQLAALDVKDLVTDIFVGIAYSLKPELFTAVTAQMAARLNFTDRVEAITTTSELLAVLCKTDAFDISKESKQASLMVVSRIPLSEKLIQFIEGSKFLPPMICEPLQLKHNHSSGYLTHNDSLILGSGNHHGGDVCLEVLNTINKVKFQLDLEFLCKVEEEPSEITIENIQAAAAKKGKYLTEAQAKERMRLSLEAWDEFKLQSYKFYSLMQQQGNKFYFTNKTDKRGRTYSCGYHLNPQGAPFKKAMLELHKQEIVEGVPT